MLGDFMVPVDSVVESAVCLDTSHRGRGWPASYGAVAAAAAGCSVSRMTNADKKKKGGQVVECRICQEEGDECDLESPCACTGTLKFAHRKCIQKWCNKKGNIICEICSQVMAFAPDYVSPSSELHPDIMAIDIRQSWSSQFDLRESHSLAISAAEQEFLNADYEGYAAASARGVAFCHTIALILMLLLFIQQVLNAMKELGMMQDISSLFDVLLQVAGLFLPCYVIARSCYFRRRQV
ncbi:probable E3 ubiquitin ligase SUD1 isoform X1 [Zingiber officinale]|uniref:probable E3 ubiquitin ligase SUD1 isoform X1 n=1 Tax=Zingiber officinale TaxID=94328 RepID=UPI001C4B10DB|nr:probable E3 ubiquitin ligase SUD1 isoform X1 [Zingiber officinale]